MEQRQTASPRSSEAAEEPLGPNGDEIPSRAAGQKLGVFGTFFFYTDHRAQQFILMMRMSNAVM